MGGVRKAHLEVLGEPLLLHAIRPFLEHPAVVSIVVALAPDEAVYPPKWLVELDDRVEVVQGGRTRAESVRAALRAFDPPPPFVAVHDAARPLVDRGILDRCLEVVRMGDAAVAGWPVVDTLKEVDEGGRVTGTPDRRRFWRAQTPQVFPFLDLLNAYDRADEAAMQATDDAGFAERFGVRVRMVEGGAWNLKVTHSEDVWIAEHLLRLRRRASEDGVGASPDRREGG